MSFLDDWLEHESWWFNQSEDQDKLIVSKYEKLLNNKSLYEENKEYEKISTIVENIIILDQLPRHIYRKCESHHIIDYYLLHAIRWSNHVFDNLSKNDIINIDSRYLCFILLPYRHSKNLNKILDIIDMIWMIIKEKREKKEKENYLSRFLNASYNQIQRELSREMCEKKVVCVDYKNDENNENDHNFETILDPIFIKNTNNILDQNDNSFDKDISHLFINPNNVYKNVIISLSGGVDSMLCAFFLKKRGYNVFAIFINYQNRKEHFEECLFLKYWCKKMNIPLFIRHIEEIHRESCMIYGFRNLYEEYTKNARFCAYQYVQNIIKKNGKNEMIDVPIVLGHNKDDTIENIITNLCHQDKYDNLHGMVKYQKQNGFLFWRPFLSISKSQIYEWAKYFNIPFLKDSTPSWSQRGKIRDIVKPCLISFDSNIENALLYLSQYLKEGSDYIKKEAKTIYENMEKQSIENKDVYIWSVRSSHDIPLSKIVWKNIFSFLSIFPSHDSIDHFIKRMTKIKEGKTSHKNIHKFEINKHLSIEYEYNSKILLYKYK